jgi:hypothetical protein
MASRSGYRHKSAAKAASDCERETVVHVHNVKKERISPTLLEEFSGNFLPDGKGVVEPRALG